MNKEEALEKIDALKDFVEECDNKKLTIEEEIETYPERFERLQRNSRWRPLAVGCSYKVLNQIWNHIPFDNNLFYCELNGKYKEIVRRKQ